MKVFDCFMYFDEDIVLDARFNILNQYVDKFVIVESTYAHNGEKRKLNFNINNFRTFKDKIIYIILDRVPDGIRTLTDDNKKNINIKILNAYKFENQQRNEIVKGLTKCSQNDLILISDADEIPNLEFLDKKRVKSKIVIFKQRLFYYKFNAENKHLKWFGSRMCSFSQLKSPQWLRNIKPKNYPKWRMDAYLSKKKYNNLIFIENGGWHFTYIKDPSGIQNKLKSYLHHIEYDKNPLSIYDIEKMVNSNKALYDHSLDRRASNKFLTGKKLDTVSLDTLPSYFLKNKDKLKNWIIDSAQ